MSIPGRAKRLQMQQTPHSKFFLKKFTVGPMAVNAYIVADPDTNKACLVDPGADPQTIKKFLDKNGYKLEFIINTHGHGDHIAANSYFDVPIYIHRLDKDFLTDPDKNLSSSFLFKIKSPPAQRLLEDGDVLELGSSKLKVIYTPGHTPGGISIDLGGEILTGDTLFNGGVGRTDFEYGDEKALARSIKEKLFVFEDSTVIHPGHGDSSTIGDERRSNPFLS
jgi:glyoxylase-like metal-dependent hydrolase (beta-lactamase superfamily II)